MRLALYKCMVSDRNHIPVVRNTNAVFVRVSRRTAREAITGSYTFVPLCWTSGSDPIYYFILVYFVFLEKHFWHFIESSKVRDLWGMAFAMLI